MIFLSLASGFALQAQTPSPTPTETATATATATATETPTAAATATPAAAATLPSPTFAKLPIALPLTYSGNLIDDFSTYTIGQFPEAWRPKGENGKRFYVVA